MSISVSFREGQRPRRKVRIVKRRFPTGVAGLSLAAVAATAVFLFAAWRWWHTDKTVPAPIRNIEEAELDWRCDQGHSFIAQAQVRGQPCPTCGEMAYPATVYHCETHGPIDVKIQFDRDEQGRLRPILFRVQGQQWVAAAGGPKCPRCELTMTRKPIDPLQGLVRPKRKSSGS